MKQIFLYTSLAVMALVVTTTGAAPEPCDGTVQLTSQSNFQVRQAGRQTFVQFDFTGLHDICLAGRSVVTGIVEGHLAQRSSAVALLRKRLGEGLRQPMSVNDQCRNTDVDQVVESERDERLLKNGHQRFR